MGVGDVAIAVIILVAAVAALVWLLISLWRLP